jgi:hypothetical protein
VVEVTFPFEFRSYESWGIALYVRFNLPPAPMMSDGIVLTTDTDALSGQRFGPFSCLCEADAAIEKWFEMATGSRWTPCSNLYAAMRAVVEGK